MLGKGLVKVRGRSDDGRVVSEVQVNVSGMSGECQLNVRGTSNFDIGGRETCIS